MNDDALQPGASIRIDSLPNLRDLGGWPTAGGGHVRRGLLYRSTDLGKLSDADMPAVAALGLRAVYDLRTESERRAEPDRVPAGVDHIVLDVLADAPGAGPAQLLAVLSDPAAAAAELGAGRGAAIMAEAYREFFDLGSALLGYRRLFSDLAQERNRPALFHCTTGKDRTGWASAAMLMLMGVSDDDVMAEYLLTNDQLLPSLQPVFDRFASAGGDPDLLRSVLGVEPDYLEAALDEMRGRHGTIAGYFTDGLGLDAEVQAALRHAFVDRS
jgi:protein-tyrosine phosphatase